MDDVARDRVDSAILSIVEKLGDTGFTTKRIRFCTHDGNIWETSPNSSCSSTEAAALKQSWPPSRTEEGFSFIWVAYLRLVTAYCAANPHEESCETLLPAPRAKVSARFRLYDFLISVAGASESCKIEDGILTLKSGKKIFVDFGPQPSGKQIAYLYKTAALATSDATVENGLLDAFSQLKSMGRAVVANYKSKYLPTMEHIRKDKVAWISIERTPEELGDRGGQSFATAFDLLKAQLGTKASKEVASNAATSGACPSAPVCVWLHEKSIRKSIKLVPVQSGSIKHEGLKLQERLVKINDSLDALVVKKIVTQADIDIIKRQYGDMSEVMTPYSAAEREAVRRRFGNPDVAAAMVGYYDVAEAFKKNVAEQEKSMAMAAIAQDGNGIFSSAESRRLTIVPILEAACRGPSESPPELFPAGAPAKTQPTKLKKRIAPTER